MIDWRHVAGARAFTPGLAAETLESLGPLSAYAKQLGIAIEEGFGVGKIQLEIFEKTVEEKLRAPCFITAYPTEVSPFARRNELDRLPQLHPVGVHR